MNATQPEHDFYSATFTVCTSLAARKQGVKTCTPYGYYVLTSPPVMNSGRYPGMERVMSWCRTKGVAERKVQDLHDSQRKGYFGCLCGSGKQACRCCGIPSPKTSA